MSTQLRHAVISTRGKTQNDIPSKTYTGGTRLPDVHVSEWEEIFPYRRRLLDETWRHKLMHATLYPGTFVIEVAKRNA